MCGIVGYIGEENSVPFLIEGLKRLEYRGYDSTGLALQSQDGLKAIRRVGKVESLYKALDKNLTSKTGIAHTRWATHGVVSEANTHPQLSSNQRYAVVHNGIIENSSLIRKQLSTAGYGFSSETDTEVIPALLEQHTDRGYSLKEALLLTLESLEGAFGILICDSQNPEILIAATKGSPLVIGRGSLGSYVASDSLALSGYTEQISHLHDFELAILAADKIHIETFKGENVDKKFIDMSFEDLSIGKQGYDTFMLKEIYEQPESLQRCLAGRLVPEDGTTKINCFRPLLQELPSLSSINIVACGTSYYASLVGAYIIEALGRINSKVEIASEVRYRNPIIAPNSLYFAVSQSGETSDTILAMTELQRKGARVLGITNRVASMLARKSDGGIYLHAGLEIAVASTKAFSSQIMAFILSAIFIGRTRNISLSAGRKIIRELEEVPQKISLVFNSLAKIKAVAKFMAQKKSCIFVGRGISYPVAMEGALKLKEISYIHAEGFMGGELKHGAIALIEEAYPVLAIVPNDELWQKNLSNIHEVKSRGATVIVIGHDKDGQLQAISDYFIELPAINPLLSPFLTVVPLQLLAYYVASLLGCNVDMPRNLAKSVTVE